MDSKKVNFSTQNTFPSNLSKTEVLFIFEGRSIKNWGSIAFRQASPEQVKKINLDKIQTTSSKFLFIRQYSDGSMEFKTNNEKYLKKLKERKVKIFNNSGGKLKIDFSKVTVSGLDKNDLKKIKQVFTAIISQGEHLKFAEENSLDEKNEDKKDEEKSLPLSQRKVGIVQDRSQKDKHVKNILMFSLGKNLDEAPKAKEKKKTTEAFIKKEKEIQKRERAKDKKEEIRHDFRNNSIKKGKE